MKMLILFFCLIPATAFSEIQLTFKDGTKMCGNYVQKNMTYCRIMAGGEMCLQRSEIVSAETVSECGEAEANGKITPYLKERALTPDEILARKRAKDEMSGKPAYEDPEWKAKKMKKWSSGYTDESD